MILTKRNAAETLFCILAVLIFSAAGVSAQDNILDEAAPSPVAAIQETESVEPAILPDSPLYFLKLFKEKVSLWLTFNPEKKADKYLRFAQMRMAEYQKMVEKGKDELASKILARYEDLLGKALAKTRDLKENKIGVLKISQKTETVLHNHIAVLENLLDKIPSPAKEAVQKALESSKNGLNQVLEYQAKEPLKEEVKTEETKPAPPEAPKSEAESGQKPAAAESPKEKEAPPAKIHQVLIKNFSYLPAAVTVKRGETVQWTNQDKAPHTVTSVKGLFNSGTIAAGGKWVYKADLAKGAYQYYCAFHLEKMKGTIIVE